MSITKARLKFCPVDGGHLIAFQVAANIWSSAVEESQNFKDGLIQGMHDAENNANPQFIESDHLISKQFSAIDSHIKEAECVFSELDKNPSYTPVIPHLVYTRTKELGTGDNLDENAQIKITYKIFDPNKKCLKDSSDMKIEAIYPSELISGLAAGLKGMKTGELREIFIHPSVAYGIYTTLNKGIYLRIEARLVDFTPQSSKSPYPALDYEEMNYVANKDRLSEEKKAGYILGYYNWQHFKKGNYVSLKRVISWIERFQKNEPFTLTTEDQDTLNRLHWIIYTSFPNSPILKDRNT